MSASLAARYARLAQAETVGPEGLALLRRSAVAVVGVGNVGGQVVGHLVAMGTGSVILVDPDTVAEENLLQGFIGEEVGLAKVDARARALARLTPSCRIVPVRADVARLGLGALRESLLIFGCPDNLRARLALNEMAGRLGVPWIDAAIDGSGRGFLSRFAVYGSAADAACFLCPWDMRALRAVVSAPAGGGCPTWRWGQPPPAAPTTLALPAVGAAVAAAAVLAGVQILLGRGADIVGRETYLDLVAGRLTAHRLPRNPRCLFDHRRFDLTPLGAATVAETFASAEARLGAGATLQIHRASLVTATRCPACGAHGHPHRLLEAMEPEEARCGCGATMQPEATGLVDRLGRAEAAGFLDRTWAQIGLPRDDVVSALRDGREVHFLVA